ncbi:4-hydroxy-tetrahydrodipicolinate synthase [Frankliniella fusca]|uniref:4-hydroxy-tetrahydrodipicolinate synthase n=1 Tax=Frankliniella fusca TaxID=407009 RepID=A0AAE1LPL0_9NEOP|nr:4-hydroxy-tetrahydrodipicolinate synthase [Frankliniella fusca]
MGMGRERGVSGSQSHWQLLLTGGEARPRTPPGAALSNAERRGKDCALRFAHFAFGRPGPSRACSTELTTARAFDLPNTILALKGVAVPNNLSTFPIKFAQCPCIINTGLITGWFITPAPAPSPPAKAKQGRRIRMQRLAMLDGWREGSEEMMQCEMANDNFLSSHNNRNNMETSRPLRQWTFHVTANNISRGETMCLTGSCPELGSWKSCAVVPMTRLSPEE